MKLERHEEVSKRTLKEDPEESDSQRKPVRKMYVPWRRGHQNICGNQTRNFAPFN
jgi:hypothetical protein